MGFMANQVGRAFCFVFRFLGELWNLYSVTNMLFSKLNVTNAAHP